jgi:predicted RecA/RadA family phage recombinase
MATNAVQKGDKLTYSNTSTAISSGDVVIVGSLVGIAEVDIAATTGVGTVFVGRGVVTVPKVTGVAWTNGMKLTWDSNVAKFDTPGNVTEATGDIENSCVAFGAALSAAATGSVLINVGVGDVHA